MGATPWALSQGGIYWLPCGPTITVPSRPQGTPLGTAQGPPVLEVGVDRRGPAMASCCLSLRGGLPAQDLSSGQGSWAGGTFEGLLVVLQLLD